MPPIPKKPGGMGGGVKKAAPAKPAFNPGPGKSVPYAQPQGALQTSPKKEASGLPGTPFKPQKLDPKSGRGFRPNQAGQVEENARKKFGPDAKKPGEKMNAIDVARALKSGDSEEKEATVREVLNSVTEAMQSGDQKALAHLAVQYTNLDKVWGLILWGVWSLATILTAICPPWVFFVGPLLVLNTMLFSPKPAYWLTELLLSPFGIGEAMEQMREIGLFDKITITGWQKGIIILIDLVAAIIFAFIVFMTVSAFCYFIKTPELVSSYLEYAPDGYIGYAVDKYFGIPIYGTCDKALSGISKFASNVTGSDVQLPGTPIDTGRWKDLVNQMAAKYQLDPCALNTLLLMESRGGEPKAIGHDNHALRPPDPFVDSSPPFYGLEFRDPDWSHGIGLVQPTIFPYNHRYGKWTDSGVPSRREWGRDYTITDLLDPETNMDFGAHLLSDKLKQNNGDLRAAFGAYNGSGPDGKYAELAMKRYNDCKAGNP